MSEMIQVKRYYDATEYPTIYNGSYWGYFKIDIEREYPKKSIIQTRNKFIKDYRIVKYGKSSEYSTVYSAIKDLDHQEFYEDILGRIIHIYSKHHTQVNPLFKQIYPMYCPYQITGMRKIETIKSKKILMKQLFLKLPDDIVKIINQYIKKCKR